MNYLNNTLPFSMRLQNTSVGAVISVVHSQLPNIIIIRIIRLS